MVRKTPKEVRRAVRALAKAVRAVADIYDMPSPPEQGKYLADEYLPDMVDIFVQQLVTSIPSEAGRQEILSSCGLDFLSEKVEALAAEWSEE